MRLTNYGLALLLAVAIGGTLSAQDFNSDGVVNCDDAPFLAEAIDTASTDIRFDLDGNGIVELADHHAFSRAANAGNRNPSWEDTNFDGLVDQRDFLIYVLNFGVRHSYGVCRGDIDFNGISERFDNDLFDYVPQIPFDASPSRPVEIPDRLSVWNGDGKAVLAESERFQLVAMPVVAPNDALATKIVVRTTDPNDLVAFFHSVEIHGDVHQVRYPMPWFVGDTPFGVDAFVSDPQERAAINVWDSRILIEDEAWGLRESGGYFSETADQSNPFDKSLAVYVDEWQLVFSLGLGSISLQDHNFGARALRSPHWTAPNSGPGSMTHEVELAYLVTPARMPTTNQPGEVTIQLGVGGSTGNLVPLDDFPVFGQDAALPVPFFAIPCDINADGRCDAADLKRLENELGNRVPELDLDQSDTVIDSNDIEVWFEWYQVQTGTSPIDGDADLDGDVDPGDLNRLAIHWLQPGGGWTGGDFDGNGFTDAVDLNLLGVNWLTATAPISVPEPFGVPLAFLILLVIGMVHPRRHRNVATCCQHVGRWKKGGKPKLRIVHFVARNV